MHPYRTSTKIKLGLIAAAVAIAVASLVFTSLLADQLEAQDAAAVEVWARAVEFQSRANMQATDGDGEAWAALDSLVAASGVPPADRARLSGAVERAANPPPDAGLGFVFDEIVAPARFSVPAVLTDSATGAVASTRNLDASVEGDPLAVAALVEEMNALHTPIPLRIAPGVVQVVHYGESPLARLIRLFPFVQLAVVGLFVLVGYLGFSYVRRSEQSSLWVGMAREAAHQLGTPLSSIIGWVELLRLGDDGPAPDVVADELERDVDRLKRVADRFEKIGSTPILTATPVAPLLEAVADYMRPRLSVSGGVTLGVAAGADVAARLNADLFEWVVENLFKNALDAMEGVPAPPGGHRVDAEARVEGGRVVVRVRDTGKGMDRATARHVFRPGFSTKRRGWGLGLSLARRIVESYHGGALTVEATRPGGGTTFRIELAAASVEPFGDGSPGAPRVAASLTGAVRGQASS